MFRVIFITVIDILLGFGCFYSSLVIEGPQFVIFVLLSSFYFYMAYLRIFRRSTGAGSKTGGVPAKGRPSLYYKDLGQTYQYEVCSGDVKVKCFSNFLFRPDGPFDLVDMLIKDGKIAVQDGSTVVINVTVRRGIK